MEPCAPRLSASTPTAPDPAKRSTKIDFSTSGPRILKRVSRRRSLEGRKAIPRRVSSRRLRKVPAITRMARDPSDRRCAIAEQFRTRFYLLAHRSELISSLPTGIERLQEAEALAFRGTIRQ